jgi:hypothetical protein
VDSHQRLDSYAPACGDRWVLFLPKNNLLFHLLSFLAKQPISPRLFFFVPPDFFFITSCSIGAFSAECSLHNRTIEAGKHSTVRRPLLPPTSDVLGLHLRLFLLSKTTLAIYLELLRLSIIARSAMLPDHNLCLLIHDYRPTLPALWLFSDSRRQRSGSKHFAGRKHLWIRLRLRQGHTPSLNTIVCLSPPRLIPTAALPALSS